VALELIGAGYACDVAVGATGAPGVVVGTTGAPGVVVGARGALGVAVGAMAADGTAGAAQDAETGVVSRASRAAITAVAIGSGMGEGWAETAGGGMEIAVPVDESGRCG
jgi:hypothetical protein